MIEFTRDDGASFLSSVTGVPGIRARTRAEFKKSYLMKMINTLIYVRVYFEPGASCLCLCLLFISTSLHFTV